MITMICFNTFSLICFISTIVMLHTVHNHLLQQEGNFTFTAQFVRARISAQARKWTRCKMGVVVFTHAART